MRESFEQQFGRLVPWLVGKSEDPPVNADRASSFEVLQDLHSFVGICVLRAHEPTRRIRADGDQSQIGPTDSLPYVAEYTTVTVAGIP